MKITRALIASLKSPNGGWSKENLKFLGVKWPPEKGWQARVIGKEIDMPANWLIPFYRTFEMDGDKKKCCATCEHVFELPKAGRWILYCGFYDGRVVRKDKLCDEYQILSEL